MLSTAAIVAIGIATASPASADWTTVVKPGDMRTIPARVCDGHVSDVHAYTLGGRSLRQRRDRFGNWQFTGYGKTVGYVPVNRDWFGARGTVRVAAWCEAKN